MIPESTNVGERLTPHLPLRLALDIGGSILALTPRSIAAGALAAVEGASSPNIEISGGANVPASGPCLVTCNHYSRPSMEVWWTALAITAALATNRLPDGDRDIHWVMTSAWRFEENRWRHRVLTPLTRWGFDHVAQVYSFVTMPPMPPDPQELVTRAISILQTVRLCPRSRPNERHDWPRS